VPVHPERRASKVWKSMSHCRDDPRGDSFGGVAFDDTIRRTREPLTNHSRPTSGLPTAVRFSSAGVISTNGHLDGRVTNRVGKAKANHQLRRRGDCEPAGSGHQGPRDRWPEREEALKKQKKKHKKKKLKKTKKKKHPKWRCAVSTGARRENTTASCPAAAARQTFTGGHVRSTAYG